MDKPLNLKDLHPCDGCGGAFRPDGHPFAILRRVQVETFGIGPNELRAMAGIEWMGSLALADVFGMVPDLKELGEPDVLLACTTCVASKTLGELLDAKVRGVADRAVEAARAAKGGRDA